MKEAPRSSRYGCRGHHERVSTECDEIKTGSGEETRGLSSQLVGRVPPTVYK